jgi:cyanophycinase-like exopeptidase
MSRLVVMGSGETAPTMVRVHRDVLATVGDGPAVLLDTPFAFQMNADELVARARTYFAQSVGRSVDVASWPRSDAPSSVREQALALLGRASWAFAGPGSPTYAMRHWRDTPVPATLAGVVQRGGTLVMGSAAAVTLGAFAVPVYEIYKVGADPAWVEGLDLVRGLTGLPAVVVPHYDNREGGTHDTRFCYLGEQRLAVLEQQLPEDVGVLGVDEHTAALLEVEARTLTVAGSGTVTVRRRGQSRTFASGESLGFDDLSALLRGADPISPSTTSTSPSTPGVDHAALVPGQEPKLHDQRGGGVDGEALSLRSAADAAQPAFEAAFAERDVGRCVEVALALEQTICDWRADTLQSDDEDHARRVLRAMVVRLGELAEVGADPRGQVAPVVDLLVELRLSARDAGDFATSDLIRDRLATAGVELRDTPDGPEWLLREDQPRV